jgi:hypothetical protein
MKNKEKKKCGMYLEFYIKKQIKYINTIYLLLKNFSVGKNGKFNSKADKMLFEFKDNWIIVDVEELNKYVKHNNKKDILLKEILEKLDWNIILNKNE